MTIDYGNVFSTAKNIEVNSGGLAAKTCNYISNEHFCAPAFIS